MAPALLALLSLLPSVASTPVDERPAMPATVWSRSTDGMPPVLQMEVAHPLPPPPPSVVRITERYGTVTIDHQKHLELRASCKLCHGEGQVSRIQFTPQLAHERCIGCHKEREHGPTHCAGCHVKTLVTARPVAATAAATVAAAGSTPPPPSASSTIGGISSGTTAAASETSTWRTFTAEWDRGTEPPAAAVTAQAQSADAARWNLTSLFTPSRPIGAGSHVLEAGAAGGSGLGLSLRVTSFGERLVTTYSFERLAGAETAWMLGLLGVGVSRTLPSRLSVVAQAVGGFDAEERPQLGLLPVLGARLGVAWWPPGGWGVRAVHLSVTGVGLITVTNAFGHHDVGGRLFATLGLVLPLPGR